jgi:hypothetical protein
MTTINWLMVFKEKIVVYSENRTRPISTFHGQSAELLIYERFQTCTADRPKGFYNRVTDCLRRFWQELLFDFKCVNKYFLSIFFHVRGQTQLIRFRFVSARLFVFSFSMSLSRHVNEKHVPCSWFQRKYHYIVECQLLLLINHFRIYLFPVPSVALSWLWSSRNNFSDLEYSQAILGSISKARV